MKKNYERIKDDGTAWNRKNKGRYTHKHIFMRRMRTTGELRQLKGDETDGYPVRRRRLNIPTIYSDIYPSRSYKRSWKDFTKKRHQWEE